MGASCGAEKEAQSSQSCVTPLAAVQQAMIQITGATLAFLVRHPSAGP